MTDSKKAEVETHKNTQAIPEKPQPPSDSPVSVWAFLESLEPLSHAAQLFLLDYTGETDLVDFKEDFDGSDREWLEITKDVLAFANTRGGYLVFGVSDKNHEKKGMPLEHAVKLSDPALVQAKLNRFISPAITSLQCTRMNVTEEGPCFAFIHVPATKRATHIVVSNGDFKRERETITALRVGEIYVRRVGWRGVVKPEDFEQLLDRRMAAYKEKLLGNIAKVVSAPTPSEVIIVSPEQATAGTASVRLSSDPSATPVRGMSVTTVPATDEEEFATICAAHRKDRSHRPSEALLFRLYARRHKIAVGSEYRPLLLSMSVTVSAPGLFWLKHARPSDVIEELAAVLGTLDPTPRFYALSIINILNHSRAISLARKELANHESSLARFERDSKNPRDLFRSDWVRSKAFKSLSKEEIAAAVEVEATERSERIAKGVGAGVMEKWKLIQMDAWLYCP